MSTNDTDERSRQTRDPTKDEYLEVDKKLGTAEYELAAEIAEANRAARDAKENARQQTRSALDNIRRGPGKRRS